MNEDLERKQRMEAMLEEILSQIAFLQARNDFLEAEYVKLLVVYDAAQRLLYETPQKKIVHLPLMVAIDEYKRESPG